MSENRQNPIEVEYQILNGARRGVVRKENMTDFGNVVVQQNIEPANPDACTRDGAVLAAIDYNVPYVEVNYSLAEKIGRQKSKVNG